jgi:hypothetical protein
MTIRSWARWLSAWPATRSIRKAPARCCATIEDRIQPQTSIPLGERQNRRGLSAPREQAPGSLVQPRGLSPVTIGFWLGGAGMGVGGGLLGALMAYRHPVAAAISVLWWGIYFGCFGASVGAVVGVLTDRAPQRSVAKEEAAGRVATELELDSRAAHAGSMAARGSGPTQPATGVWCSRTWIRPSAGSTRRGISA